MLKVLILYFLILLSISRATAQEAEGFVVDAETVVAQVSPFAYGANYGPLSFVSVDLFEQAQASGITFLRFPGGRWGDLNDIQESQVDDLMRLARLMDATPSIHVRLENGTPEAAADLVRYANVDNDYDIRYWYVGNEPNLFDDYTVAEMIPQWRAIVAAMKEVDPTITIIGPDVSQWNGTPQIDPLDPEGADWLREFLRANGELVDIVAVHRYPFPLSQADPRTPVEDLLNNVHEWDNTLENLRQVILEETGRTDLPIAMTEASSHWSGTTQGETTPDSHLHAVWWANALGYLLEDEPFIVAYYELQTPIARGGWGLLERYETRPTYEVYQLYQLFGQFVLDVSGDDPHMSVFAAQRVDGALTLMAINRNAEAYSVPLSIAGYEGAVTEVRLFAEDQPAQVVDNTHYDGSTLTLPGYSVTLITLE